MITEVKERINIIDIFNTYGVHITRHNKALCPFHKEKTPSMSVYPDTNSFYCFGCGIGGDAITFVERLFNLDPLRAAQKINEDFNLGLSGHELSEEQRKDIAAQIRQQDESKKALSVFQEWERRYYIYVCEKIQLLDDLLGAANPKHTVDKFSDSYAYAINLRQLLEYHWNVLWDGDIDDKINLYAEVSKAVNYEQKYKRSVTGTNRQDKSVACG